MCCYTNACNAIWNRWERLQLQLVMASAINLDRYKKREKYLLFCILRKKERKYYDHFNIIVV